jgi:hypothetical protein
MNEAFDEVANLREAVARLGQAVDELRRSGVR